MSRNVSWSARIASWGCPSFDQIEGFEAEICRWRFAQLEIAGGSLGSIRGRWWPMIASEWGAYSDQYFRPLPVDTCRLYYAFFRRSRGYMTLNYAHSGPNTSYGTIYRAMQVVDQIAAIWNAEGIVCHVTNRRGTERLMNRWGYQQHAPNLGPGNYIKRRREGGIGN